MSERSMITRMTTTPRPQQRYDHRLRDLVHRTGDVTIATDLGVPRSTARGWLGSAPTVMVSLDVANLSEPELRQEIVKLRRRMEKLAALLRLAELSARTFCTFGREFSPPTLRGRGEESLARKRARCERQQKIEVTY